jgi:hypothetical protein
MILKQLKNFKITIISLLLILFIFDIAFAKNIENSYNKGIAIFQTGKYRISVVLTPDLDGAMKEWTTKKENEAPHIRTTYKVKLNQEIALFLVISPTYDMQNAFVTYSVIMKEPSGKIHDPLKFTLANGRLRKGKINLMKDDACIIFGDQESDIGKYEIIIDFFDNGLYFKTINMEFEITK